MSQQNGFKYIVCGKPSKSHTSIADLFSIICGHNLRCTSQISSDRWNKCLIVSIFFIASSSLVSYSVRHKWYDILGGGFAFSRIFINFGKTSCWIGSCILISLLASAASFVVKCILSSSISVEWLSSSNRYPGITDDFRSGDSTRTFGFIRFTVHRATKNN